MLLLVLAVVATLLVGRSNAEQPTYDFDFGSPLFGPPTGNDQGTTLAVDSVNGNDANDGTLPLPKLTLPATLTNNEQLGLYRGSRFAASLPLTDTSLSGISVRGLSLARGALPLVSALDPAPTSGFTSNGDGTYSYTWTAESGVANDGYSNVYVVEINTATEAQQPIASRRRMTNVASQADAATSAGAVYVQSLGNNQWKATLRPVDSLAPGSGSYRYEVVSRVSPANWGAPNNPGDGAMSGLELVGGSSGYGALGSPVGFDGDRLAILHATTHNAVLGGGSLARSVFYENGDDDSIMLAWYTSDPTGLRWSTDHCLFYGNVGDRNRDMLISHSSNGHSYDRGDVADCALLGGRWSDGSLHGVGFGYNNVAAGTISRVYATGLADALGDFSPLGLEVKGSVFRDVGRVKLCGSFHDNIVYNTNLANNNGAAGFVLQTNGQSATNNILWTRSTSAADVNFLTQYGSANTGTLARNVVVLDALAGSGGNGNYGVFSNGSGSMTLDYNLVIQTGGSNLVCYGTPAGTTLTWAAYRAAFPALDAHSLYLDLRADARGIKAVFADPANGDFRWAQTDVGSRCAAYCQANQVGPATVTTHWPTVPTVDEAVAAISLLPPKVTSPGALNFTLGVYRAYQITTDLDGTSDAPTSYGTVGQPAWLSVNASTGVLSGGPPQDAVNATASVSATNRAGMGSAVLGIAVQTAFMAWQNTYFTATELNDPSISGLGATPAGDGIPNLLKYALGLDPKRDGTTALPTISVTPVGDAKFLTLTYTRSLAASDVTFTVEVSGDLQAWYSGASATATVSATTNAAGTMQAVVQRDLTPTSSARERFIRLRISQP